MEEKEETRRFVLPRQIWFVFFYMAALYLVYIAAIHYARQHPYEPPEPPAAATPEH